MIRLFVLLVLLTLAGCDIFVCGEEHAAVSRARALSQEQLGELYAFAYEIRDSQQKKIDPATVPEAIGLLQPIDLRCLRASRPCIKLAGCLDEYIFLRFHEEDDPRIELEWAEGPYELGSEVLWRKKDKAHTLG